MASVLTFDELRARPILVTGAAGFIGSFLATRLLDEGLQVVGLDNFTPYYDPELKQARLARLRGRNGFAFETVDIADQPALMEVFDRHRPEIVVNLAAQPGVRYSLQEPHAYAHSNLNGFLGMLEACRHHAVKHLVYASSSSVYGSDPTPFSLDRPADNPLNLYAATKRANELMAHAYAHLFAIPMTGLRFFTVYGPWGRPDMAYYIFARKIAAGEPIDLFDGGEALRDFTYVDDIVEGVRRVMARVPAVEPGAAAPPVKLYNIGNNRPEKVLHLVDLLEAGLGRRAERRLLPAQPGEVPATWADIDELTRDTGFAPTTSLADGIERFVRWFRDYHRV